MEFSRSAALRRLEGETFDVLVIGGGVTGAGIALDAASRGFRTALVERDDFASGTSSKSSKLVHGGIRYLQAGEIALVYENLRERQLLLRNAPHLVTVLPFLVPILKQGGVVNRRIARAFGAAMWAYDLTGGMRIGKLHRRLSADQTIERFPSLRRELVAHGYLYYDAHVDDARLTLSICRTATEHYDAAIANGVAVEELTSVDGRVNGARVSADGAPFMISARVVVNATGIWSDEVRAMPRTDGQFPAPAAFRIRPAKGIHLTFDRRHFGTDIGVLLHAADGRPIFVLPWEGLTYVGTTDTDYAGPLVDPQCTPEDIRYLLDAVNATLLDPVTAADIRGSWAGLRPLVEQTQSTSRSTTTRSTRTADLSRRHTVTQSTDGLITITGGKLTTYRKMAQDTVDRVALALGSKRKCRTRTLTLINATTDRTVAPARLLERYGTAAADVLALGNAQPHLLTPLVPGLDYVKAEAVYAARHEMVRTLDDVLTRRTRARILARDASALAAPDVAALIGAELGWDPAVCDAQVDAYRASIALERAATGF